MEKQDYMNDKVSWIAHSVGWMALTNLKEGKYPNGQKLTKADIEECKEKLLEANQYLIEHNCKPFVEEIQPIQLRLKF
jgi:hypothetical protein